MLILQNWLVLQTEVVKVISDLSADEVSTDGVAFLLSASLELSEMLVSYNALLAK